MNPTIDIAEALRGGGATVTGFLPVADGADPGTSIPVTDQAVKAAADPWQRFRRKHTFRFLAR
jgi:hypothetical protein